MYTQYDVIVLVTILIFMTISLVKGGVKSVVGILKWYGAFFVALMFYPYVKEMVGDIVADSVVANATAVVGVYILAVLFLAVIGGIIINSFGLFVGGVVDRLLGAVVGFLIGYIIVSSVHFLMESVFAKNTPDWFKNAETYPFTGYGAEFLKDYLQGSLDTMKDDFGVDLKGEDGNIDPKKAQEFMAHPEVKKLMKDPRVQELAKDGAQQIKNSDVDLNLEGILERAGQLKDLGYEPEEIKSIIEQEQQMNK